MTEVREFALPDLGEGLTEAEITRWLVAVGDVVAVDQPIVEVETAKAMVEVPCPYPGVITARYGEEGTEVPVGAPLVTVAVGADATSSAAGGRPAGGPAGASASAATIPSAGASAGASAGTPTGAAAGAPAAASGGSSRAAGDAAAASGNVLVGYGTTAGTARRRRRTRPQTAAGPGAPPPGPAASTTATATATATRTPTRTAGGPAPVISPLVRRLAREYGVDLGALTGSGPDGLILRADVERAAQPAAPPATPSATPSTARYADAEPGPTRIPLRGMRGAAADKLSRSRREIPDATCWVDADATELLAARRAMNAGPHPPVSLLALLGRVCTAALDRYPELNAAVDTETREIVQLPAVHLGFAAQTDRGLLVPVVRNAHRLGADALSAEMSRLTEAARAGTLPPGDLTGGTFTLNNYGVFGVDGSTPIINHPEAAMLGVGRITPKPWVHQGELAVRHVVQLSLTFDHRVCDGGTAGGFLRYVADCVEQPATLLRTL